MGELIILAERRADRSRASVTSQPAFFFDLSCPFSYLAAEQADRLLGDAVWVPVAKTLLARARPWSSSSAPLRRVASWSRGEPAVRRGVAQLRAEAELRALELRLPLVWPDRFPFSARPALRAAAFASELGAGDRFALAASRLAFCGGFDLDDPETLAEAAAAAGVPLDPCLAAAREEERDIQLKATARGLASQGIRELPAVRMGGHWFDGLSAPAQASALLRTKELYEGPVAPLM